jgi:hypothetical protein
MYQFRLTRFIRKRSQTAVVLVMLPLVLMNGRTITGCGCNGHFEAVCHCHCGASCGGCCGQASARSCCANKTASGRESDSTIPQGRSERAQSHHCSQIAEYVVVTATIAPTLADDDSQASALALVALDLPPVSAAAYSVHDLRLDTRPPNDLVVILHRLVI